MLGMMGASGLFQVSYLSSIVLAGGQSSRMGQDKALLEINGVPLLRRICQVAQACTVSVYVVTPWPDRYQTILSSDEQIVIDRHSQGPLVGFAQGLAQVTTEWVLLLACDLPNLRADALQTWITHIPSLTQEIALLPLSEKGWQPLCGFYRRDCLNQLQAAIDQGERSFQRWLAALPVRELPDVDQNLLVNCNTPQDLAELCSRNPP